CRPHRKTLEDRAVATENPEAALEAVPGARHWTPRPPPPGLPGATDGNHGGSTGTVGGPGSANAREQERRAAASNIPDSVSYFVSPNGPTTGPRRAPAIAPASHNFMERRLAGGILRWTGRSRERIGRFPSN